MGSISAPPGVGGRMVALHRIILIGHVNIFIDMVFVETYR